MTRRPEAHLVLSDGTTFEGEAAGSLLDGGIVTGEAVFNTALSGYQEVITDPSYAGQVVAFTYPHIGNYGVTSLDAESASPHLEGIIVRDLPPLHSSWRAEGSLEDFLIERGVGAITGVDTRRLTRHLRDAGAMPCAFGTGGRDAVAQAAAMAEGTDGKDLASTVSTSEPYSVGSGALRVVALDLGIKSTIVRHLAGFATVTVVPSSTTADEILALDPDGIFLSNGPGDPGALGAVAATVADLVGTRPILGICLGHQILAEALGGRTYKLPFGHHGSNHPVMNLATGQVEITAQNHNYAVEAGSITGAHVTHVNLNDEVIEGIAVPSARAVSVQHHPEAGPGPHDAAYLFDEFARTLSEHGGR